MLIYGYTPEDIKAKVMDNKFKIAIFIVYSLILISI